jgi:peptidoglycan hydrolase-like protein with peptidoglycan-binding domain
MYHYLPSGNISASQILTYQRVLAIGGFLPRTASALDGRLGGQTAAALRLYQAGQGIPASGTFDARTLAALDNSLAAAQGAGININSLPGAVVAASPTAARGSHPKVNAIATASGPVAVPEEVSKMIPPAAVAQLQKMPAQAAQSFVNDLAQKVATGAAQGADALDAGTGKSDVSAVPVLQPNGTVTAALSTTPVTGWAALSDVEKVAIGIGAVAVTGTLIYLVARK